MDLGGSYFCRFFCPCYPLMKMNFFFLNGSGGFIPLPLSGSTAKNLFLMCVCRELICGNMDILNLKTELHWIVRIVKLIFEEFYDEEKSSIYQMIPILIFKVFLIQENIGTYYPLLKSWFIDETYDFFDSKFPSAIRN